MKHHQRLLLKSEKLLKAQLSPSQRFVLVGIVNALPSEWRSILKGNAFTPPSLLNESSYILSVKGEMMDRLNGQKYTLCLLRLLWIRSKGSNTDF